MTASDLYLALSEAGRWARKAREATEKRDEAIRALRAQGASLRAIAEKVGLSHTAVANIVSR